MKNFLLVAAVLLAGITLCAQAPNKMSYQMVVRNSSNAIVASQPVGVRISILQASATGTAVFVETQSPTTNANGLASFIIGEGTLVSGSFAGIEWGNGPYFIKIEVDPAGGTNYTITSTTQLLSVPYALHAGSVAKLGKTYIIINGEVTDAEAAAVIAQDGGPQTQFVWITNTTGLTHIDLSVISALAELKVEGNADLVSLSAPNLRSVGSDLNVSSNQSLVTLSLPVLSKLGRGTSGGNTIGSNNKLAAISFPALTGSTTAILQLTNNEILSSVSFPVLQSFGSLFLGPNPLLTSFSAPTLTSARFTLSGSSFTTFSIPTLVSGNISLYQNPLLTSCSFPVLNSGDVSASFNPLLTSCSCPVLKSGGGMATNNPLLISFSFPELTNGGITLIDNQALPAALVPKLTTGTGISITGNYALKDFSCPLLTTLSGDISISSTRLNSLSFPVLQSAKNLSITNSDSLSSLSFPQLVNAGNITIQQNDKVTAVLFPQLVNAQDISVNGILTITGLSFSQLVTCKKFGIFPTSVPVQLDNLVSAGDISINNSAGGVSMTALTKAGGITIRTQSTMSALPKLASATNLDIQTATSTSISVPLLKGFLSTFTITGSNLSSLLAPLLDTVSYINITGTNLASISLPQLRRVKLVTTIINNANLTSISWPLLDGVGTDLIGTPTMLNLGNNRLPSSEINAVLAKLVSIAPPLINRKMDMKQTPAAPPTGQGLTDKATLVARPNVVNTD
jgi:hypothetical protein